IGIQVGGIGALAPERRADLTRLAFRAMLGGTLACCMTGCIAAVLI
ncbi:MAG: nucleoside transporter C-terminal domain-containing protein, partial [Planctomyces sp.]